MNYGELKSLLKPYLGNNREVLSQLQYFVELGERKIYRVLRVPAMEKQHDYSWVDGEDNSKLDIPADFLEARLLLANGTPMLPDADQRILSLRQTRPGSQGTPQYYSRVGQTFVMWPFPGDGAEFTLIYYADRSGTLDADEDTTPLLRIAPDLHVYATCYEVAARNRMPEDMAAWQAAFDGAIGELNLQAQRSRITGGPQSVNAIYPDG